MAIEGWVMMVIGLMVFLKTPKQPSSHRTKKTPQLPSPTEKKSMEGDWSGLENSASSQSAPLQVVHTPQYSVLTLYEEAEVPLSIQMTLVCNESRTAGAVHWRGRFWFVAPFVAFLLSFLGSVVWTSTDLEEFRHLKGKKPFLPRAGSSTFILCQVFTPHKDGAKWNSLQPLGSWESLWDVTFWQ